jgi:signal recognition particle GTPase
MKREFLINRLPPKLPAKDQGKEDKKKKEKERKKKEKEEKEEKERDEKEKKKREKEREKKNSEMKRRFSVSKNHLNMYHKYMNFDVFLCMSKKYSPRRRSLHSGVWKKRKNWFKMVYSFAFIMVKRHFSALFFIL